jgi:outer membrane protein TolC
LNRYGVRASVAQPLFTGLRIRSEVDAAQAEAGAAAARVHATEVDVVFRTRRAYWRLYEAEAQQDAATFALREIERRLQDIENREAVGLETETDVLRVRSRRDRLRVAVIRAQTDVDTARRALNDAMGRPLESMVQLADTVRIVPAAPDPERALARADRRRGDLRALRETILARQAGIRAAHAGWFPTVSLSGSYLYARPNDQLFPPEDRFQGTWEAGVSLSWQLSAQTRPEIERARARASASRHRLEDRQRAVQLQIRTLLQEVEQARRATEAATTSLESARAAYRSARTRYDAGLSIVSDLLDAERTFRAARADVASTQSDYAVARAALDRAMGRGLPDSTDR